MNDFVANAYGVASIENKEGILQVYKPSDIIEDRVRLVFGVGTGLGVSMLCRPSQDAKNFQAYPSEGGMVKMQLYN